MICEIIMLFNYGISVDCPYKYLYSYMRMVLIHDRLEGIMLKLVSKNQYIFLKGRNITKMFCWLKKLSHIYHDPKLGHNDTYYKPPSRQAKT